jgi:hypothetical protein
MIIITRVFSLDNEANLYTIITRVINGILNMKNQLIDLNNHLFAQMERLGDEELSKDELTNEINRSKAMTGISNQIVNNASLALEAKKLQIEYGNVQDLPAMIESKKHA